MSKIKATLSLASMEFSKSTNGTLVEAVYKVTGGHPVLAEPFEIRVKATATDERNAVQVSEFALRELAEVIHDAAKALAERTT